MEAALRDELIKTLRDRFAKNMRRHTGIDWSSVQAKLEASLEKLQALCEMERTGGEPDIVGRDEKTGEVLFYDCSPESPVGRRSICYDRGALDSRKENKPSGNAIQMASSIGIEILTEQQYRELPLVVRCSVIVATTMFSSIITVLNPTTPPEAFVVGSRFSL